MRVSLSSNNFAVKSAKFGYTQYIKHVTDDSSDIRQLPRIYVNNTDVTIAAVAPVRKIFSKAQIYSKTPAPPHGYYLLSKTEEMPLLASTLSEFEAERSNAALAKVYALVRQYTTVPVKEDNGLQDDDDEHADIVNTQ